MIRLYWAFLWLLFFLVLGLRRERLTRYTGAVCATQSWVTGWIPAFLLLTGRYGDYKNLLAISLAVFAVVVLGALYIPLGPGRVAATETSRAPAPK